MKYLLYYHSPRLLNNNNYHYNTHHNKPHILRNYDKTLHYYNLNENFKDDQMDWSHIVQDSQDTHQLIRK